MLYVYLPSLLFWALDDNPVQIFPLLSCRVHNLQEQKVSFKILSIRVLEISSSLTWQYLTDASSFCNVKSSFLFFMISWKWNVEGCHQKNEKEEIKFQRFDRKNGLTAALMRKIFCWRTWNLKSNHKFWFAPNSENSLKDHREVSQPPFRFFIWNVGVALSNLYGSLQLLVIDSIFNDTARSNLGWKWPGISIWLEKFGFFFTGWCSQKTKAT